MNKKHIQKLIYIDLIAILFTVLFYFIIYHRFGFELSELGIIPFFDKKLTKKQR